MLDTVLQSAKEKNKTGPYLISFIFMDRDIYLQLAVFAVP
jgi:hypothetical protein